MCHFRLPQFAQKTYKDSFPGHFVNTRSSIPASGHKNFIPKNLHFLCASCLSQPGIFDTYFTISTENIQIHPLFGILFHKHKIRLTQNTFWFIIWILPVHRLFMNQFTGRKESFQNEPESKKHVHRNP